MGTDALTQDQIDYLINQAYSAVRAVAKEYRRISDDSKQAQAVKRCEELLQPFLVGNDNQ